MGWLICCLCLWETETTWLQSCAQSSWASGQSDLWLLIVFLQCLPFLKSEMRCGDPFSVLRETLAFSSRSWQWEIPSKFAWSFLNFVFWWPFPTSFSSRPFCQCPFWVSHGCAGTASWGGTCCLEVIPTYWKPSPHLYFGQLSIPGSSEPSFLACNSQAPHCWWEVWCLIQVLQKALQHPGKSSNGVPFLPLCFSNDVRAKNGFAFWNISSFCFQAGRNEISPSTSALLSCFFLP